MLKKGLKISTNQSTPKEVEEARSGKEMEWAWCFLEWKGNAAGTGWSNFSFGFEIKELVWVTHYIACGCCVSQFSARCAWVQVSHLQKYASSFPCDFLTLIASLVCAAVLQVIPSPAVIYVCLSFLFLMERRKSLILKRGINTYLWVAASLEMNIYNMLLVWKLGSWRILFMKPSRYHLV